MQMGGCFVHRQKNARQRKSKLQIEGIFENPITAEYSFILYLLNKKEIKRYLIHVDELGRFEEFYNFINVNTVKGREK